jgi:hypothetical protein
VARRYALSDSAESYTNVGNGGSGWVGSDVQEAIRKIMLASKKIVFVLIVTPSKSNW